MFFFRQAQAGLVLPPVHYSAWVYGREFTQHLCDTHATGSFELHYYTDNSNLTT